ERGLVQALADVPVMHAVHHFRQQLQSGPGRRVGHAQGLGEHQHHEKVLLVPVGAGEDAPIGGHVELTQPPFDPLEEAHFRGSFSSSVSSTASSGSFSELNALRMAMIASTITQKEAMMMITSSENSSHSPWLKKSPS